MYFRNSAGVCVEELPGKRGCTSQLSDIHVGLNHFPNVVQMVIAVDFDGTIVEHRYPAIGVEIPFAVETLRLLSEEHHRLILWTVREGALLDDAVEFCKNRGLKFYAVNPTIPKKTPSSRIFA